MSVSAVVNREFARRLRRGQTPQESQLWRHLRAHRFAGCKFRRQYPLPPYVLDFVCLSGRLVIELDGGQHGEPSSIDQARDAFLAERGFRVLRFWNHEVNRNLDAVLENIQRALVDAVGATARHPLPNPLPPAGEGANATHP